MAEINIPEIKQIIERLDDIQAKITHLVDRQADRLYTMSEAAELTGRSYSFIRRKVLAGAIETEGEDPVRIKHNQLKKWIKK